MTEKTAGTLADFGAEDLHTAGGKGANLGELVRWGSRYRRAFFPSSGGHYLCPFRHPDRVAYIRHCSVKASQAMLICG